MNQQILFFKTKITVIIFVSVTVVCGHKVNIVY